jgi:cytochrome bd ubiquinol oxidase subunit II
MRPLVLDTVPIWALILGFGVFFHVLLDGFDLGVGILFGLAPDTPSRNLVMNSIAPIWDGNETWLVLGGLALLAAFPLAFAIIIPAVYFPILVMLLALIFRGVAFEFRYRDAEHKTFWDYGFVYGSAIGTFAQGVGALRSPGHRAAMVLLAQPAVFVARADRHGAAGVEGVALAQQ